MSDYNKNKFQDSTQVILDNLSEEYKNLLVARALVNNNLKSTKDIVPQDLIILDEEFKNVINRNKYNNKKKKSIQLIKFLSMFYVMIGIWLYIFTNIDTENSIQKISLLIAGIGLLTTLLAQFIEFYVNQFSVRKTQHFEFKPENEFELVKKWNEIEKLSYMIIKKENDISNNLPITKLFKVLFTENILDNKDMENYKYILNLRNSIVHPTEKTINQDQIIMGLEKADSIILKLKKYV
ncbi:hypothetical protein C0132_22240 [Priestia aryabhattai]|uniref:hypothetical protein n=1 Tax=Priestia aryabhattai TaxID=412384 RepID=UPI0037488208